MINSLRVAFPVWYFSGLELLINIDKDEYLDFLTDGFGIRVDIHDKGTRAYPLESGVSISPGAAAFIGLQMVENFIPSHLYHNSDPDSIMCMMCHFCYHYYS